MPVKEAPAKEAQSKRVLLKPEKNPHINLQQPASVECFPESKGGAVTFDNGGPEDVLVEVTPYALFRCSQLMVKANHSINKPVKTEQCKGQYRVSGTAFASAAESSTEGTDTTDRVRSEPKDIIVP